MHKNQLRYMQKKVNLKLGDSKPGQSEEDLSSILLKDVQKRASLSFSFKQQ